MPLRKAAEAVVAISLWMAEIGAAFIVAYLLISIVVEELFLSAAVVLVAVARVPIRRWLSGTPWTF